MLLILQRWALMRAWGCWFQSAVCAWDDFCGAVHLLSTARLGANFHL